jgi:hypothetical protein
MGMCEEGGVWRINLRDQQGLSRSPSYACHSTVVKTSAALALNFCCATHTQGLILPATSCRTVRDQLLCCGCLPLAP